MYTLFFSYLLPTSVAVSFFWSFYQIFLRKDTHFVLNRCFLIVGLIFSLALPFIHIYYSLPIENIVTNSVAFRDDMYHSIASISTVGSLEKSFDFGQLFFLIYIIGAILFFVRLLIHLGSLVYIMNKYGVRRENNRLVVYMNNETDHFSFWYITFINRAKLAHDDEQVVFAHETAHIKQFHFVDLLFVEIACVLLWFNPFIWLYKHSLKTVHEFLADQEVLKKGISKTNYYQLLFTQCVGFRFDTLTNSFHYSTIKTRIRMMTTTKTNNKSTLKFLLVLPAVAALLFLFSCQNETAIVEPLSDSASVMPDRAPVYKNGDSDIAAFFLSTLNFDDWKSKITNFSDIQITFTIEEDGSASAATNLRNQGSYTSTDFPNCYDKMEKWTPALKDGKPIKSTYVYHAGDVLREALQKRGITVFWISIREEELK